MLKIPRIPLARHGASTVLVKITPASSLEGSVNNSSCFRFLASERGSAIASLGTRRQGKEMHDYLLEKDPVPFFRNLSSSNVGSQTKSLHIWQNRLPLLDSTSRSISDRYASGRNTLQNLCEVSFPCSIQSCEVVVVEHCRHR
jgi:hypothetical protein